MMHTNTENIVPITHVCYVVVYTLTLSTAVYDVFWVSSKTGNQCCSVSTDGQMMWWDTRKLSEPQDTIQVD
jgi:hypothetical protein